MPKLAPLPTLVAINALAFGLLAWNGAQSQTPPQVHDVLQARQIDLVNADGKVVAQLYVSEDGGGSLRLRNGAGDVRVKLGPSNDGSEAILLLMDRTTEPTVRLASGPDKPSLELGPFGQPSVRVAP
jgi:hypothetical protein